MTPEELRDGYREDPEWNPILRAIADAREGEESTAKALLSELGDDWTNRDVVNCLKEFESIGAGRVTKGARGRPTRILWTCNPKELAAYLLSETDDTRLVLGRKSAASYLQKRLWSMSELRKLAAEAAGVEERELRLTW